jgi:DNA polymerase-3 subunit delta'
MSWSAIVNQHRVKTLLRALRESDRLPHALLFHGPEGVGKEAAAIELARSLNCESGRWEACGFCPSCRRMHALEHPRLQLVFALPHRQGEDGAFDKFTDAEMGEVREQLRRKAADPYYRIAYPRAQEIKISSIRDIRRGSAFRSAGGGRSVVVICEADRMNQNSANALLKTLEEPGGDLLLVLCTARREALPATIVSRCQQLRFELLADDDIRAALEHDPSIDPAAIPLAVQLAAGSYARARELASGEPAFSREDVLAYVRAVVLWQPPAYMEHVRRIAALDDRADVVLFLSSVASWFRDVLAVQEGHEDAIRNTDLADAIVKFARFYTATDCPAAVAEIEAVVDLIGKNVHLPTTLIVLAQRLRRCIFKDPE